MKKLHAGLILVAAAASLSLTACGKKQEEQVPAAASSGTGEATAVTNVEVSPEMIDAAPLEQEGSAASETAAK
jgi:predicted small lipoprotein YifL